MDPAGRIARISAPRLYGGPALTVSKHQHNLLDKSTHAVTVLGSWANIEGLIPEADIVKMFRDKSKRRDVVSGSALWSDVSIVD